MDPKDIPNFEELCLLLKAWDEEPEDPYWIQMMQNMEGYNEWLEWMETNRPEELP